MSTSKKKAQRELGEQSPAFAAAVSADPRAARRGRSIIEIAGDAMERKYGTIEEAAQALDSIFGPEGRPVSATVLRAALRQAERNYFRAEWLVVVLDDAELRQVLGPTPMSPAEENAAMREHMARHAPGELARYDRTRGAR